MSDDVTPADDPLVVSLDGFAEALRETTAASRDTAQAVRQSDHRRRRNTRIAGVIAALLLVGTTGILAIAWQLHGHQEAILDTQAAIADCTDLERRSAECARRAQANTARAVRAIADGQLAIAYAFSVCERVTPTPDELRVCVEAELAAIAAGTTKAPRLPSPSPT
jgi:hypothetical protein